MKPVALEFGLLTLSNEFFVSAIFVWSCHAECTSDYTSFQLQEDQKGLFLQQQVSATGKGFKKRTTTTEASVDHVIQDAIHPVFGTGICSAIYPKQRVTTTGNGLYLSG